MTYLLTALRQTIDSLRMVWLIYGMTLVLGLLVALPTYSMIQTEDQDSLAFLRLLDGFDYTVVTDFLSRSGGAVKALLGVVRWVNLTYLFLTIFLAGGILLRFAQLTGLPGQPVGTDSRFTVGAFWQGCSLYVGRMLGAFGVTLLFVVVSAVIWLLVGILLGAGLSDSYSERGVFWLSAGAFTGFALTATLLLCIGDMAKVLLVRNDARGAFRAFGLAGRLVFRNLATTYGSYLLLIGIGTALFGLYFGVESLLGAGGWPGILLLFLVQQALIFARTGLKIWWLGTAWQAGEYLPRPVAPAPAPVLPEPLAPSPDDQPRPLAD